MTTSEFGLIKKYFETQPIQQKNVVIGIGDDAAVVNIPTGHQLVITTDTLVSGVHFPETTTAHDIGFKSLAVNLSDLAAMGATPAWVTLSLTLPSADENWLKEFCQGFYSLTSRYQTQLIGGDLSSGPLSITVGAFGFIPNHQAITRSQAKPGDLVYVTHTLGDAALGLLYLQEKINLSASESKAMLLKLNRPEPQIEIGIKLRNIASSAIDISDGLAADLGHILENSHVGAEINLEKIPIGKSLLNVLSKNDALSLALSGGDDYQLCFTVPPEKQALLETTLPHSNYHYTCIGIITAEKGLNLLNQDGTKYVGKIKGYDHFQK